MYFKSYKISEDYQYVSNEDMRILYACDWLVEQQTSIRKAAKYWGFSKSTLWRKIHKNCKDLSPELYKQVVKQLEENYSIRGEKKDGSK